MQQDLETARLLGEIQGQLRELNHSSANRAQEAAAFARQLAKLEVVPEQIARIEGRLLTMEFDKYKRDGAMGIGAWLLKSPVVAWVISAGVTAWAFLTKGAGQ